MSMFHSTTIILRAISREQLGTSGSEDLESTKKNSCRVPKVSDRAISIFLQILRPMPVLIFPCLSNYASNPCAIILVGKISVQSELSHAPTELVTIEVSQAMIVSSALH